MIDILPPTSHVVAVERSRPACARAPGLVIFTGVTYPDELPAGVAAPMAAARRQLTPPQRVRRRRRWPVTS
ncbi:hypothetical protein ABZX12_32535 [Kribbella sp. NPDC003505]|uniref:hypothetical protein n=1 Tax=Kribbella sp. NPDC003505 TaxID=3154448 RepID=UPI0033A0FBC4